MYFTIYVVEYKKKMETFTLKSTTYYVTYCAFFLKEYRILSKFLNVYEDM